MGKADLPYIWIAVRRKRGREYRYAYFRRGGMCERLPALPGEPGFESAYQEALQRSERGETNARPTVVPGSVAALVEAYRASPQFGQLAPKTKRDYERILVDIADRWGDLPAKRFPSSAAYKRQAALSATPRAANYFVSVLSVLFGWAVPRQVCGVERNPASGVEKLKTANEKHRPWEEAEIAVFRDRWSADTVERVAFEILLSTGQRGEDVAPMLRQHYHQGTFSVCQLKTGTRVWVPASDECRAVLEPWIASQNAMVILTTRTGRPFRIDHFRHVMARAFTAAGLVGVTAHGLRYTAATVLKELGCDEETIASITGHSVVAMVRTYTRRKRLASLATARVNRARKRHGNGD